MVKICFHRGLNLFLLLKSDFVLRRLKFFKLKTRVRNNNFAESVKFLQEIRLCLDKENLG